MPKLIRAFAQSWEKSAKLMHILKCNYFWTQVSLSYFALFKKIYLYLAVVEGRFFNAVFYN